MQFGHFYAHSIDALWKSTPIILSMLAKMRESKVL